jgi:hypothetical protein
MTMKRTLLIVAVMITGLFAARLMAGESTTFKPKMVTPDWHYRWHEGRWWYWMPSSTWMVWTGSSWTPYEQFSRCAPMYSASQAKPYTAGYGSYETQNENAASQPVYTGGNDQPSYSGRSDSDYGSYGWGWGPGTVYGNSPGRRF